MSPTAPAGERRPADYVVVGGGLVGAALAYELAGRGAEVVLVDRHDRGRATDAGAGILSPETNPDPDPGVFAVGRAAAAHYDDLVECLAADGVLETGYRRVGSLVVAERPGDDATMEAAVRLVLSRGTRAVEVDPDEPFRRVPVLGPVRRALYNPDGRRVDGRMLRSALLAAAERRGVRVEHAGVTGIGADRTRHRVVAVHTESATIAAGALAVAGGAWTAELAGALRTELPVGPLKGQIVHLGLPGIDTACWPIVQPILGFYLVPWPGGRVACGGTMEADAGFDHRVTADGVHQLLRECLRTAPGLARAELLEVRVGLRPVTRDGRPVVGRLPEWENAFVATGHGAEGLLLGPFSARLLADAMTSPGASAGTDARGGPSAAAELGRWSPSRLSR